MTQQEISHGTWKVMITILRGVTAEWRKRYGLSEGGCRGVGFCVHGWLGKKGLWASCRL